MTEDFQGRVAFVTGAASGIGAAVCRQLAGAGAIVVAADIDGGAAHGLAVGTEGTIHPLALDVSDPDAVNDALAGIVRDHGALHMVVNNAGIAGQQLATAEYPLDEWHRVLAVNLHGVFHVMK